MECQQASERNGLRETQRWELHVVFPSPTSEVHKLSTHRTLCNTCAHPEMLCSSEVCIGDDAKIYASKRFKLKVFHGPVVLQGGLFFSFITD